MSNAIVERKREHVSNIENRIHMFVDFMDGNSQKEKEEKAKKFTRSLAVAVQANDKLAACTAASFMSACIACAQVNLEPNTPQQFAYLIPYKDVCQFQLGYKGMLQLVYRSGLVMSLNSDVVYKKEVENGNFIYERGIEPRIIHSSNLLSDDRVISDSNYLVAAYAGAILRGGEKVSALLDKGEVESARSRSAGWKANQKYGYETPWLTDTRQMWKKTAIKSLCGILPQNEQIRTIADAIGFEDKSDNDEPLTPMDKGEVISSILNNDGWNEKFKCEKKGIETCLNDCDEFCNEDECPVKLEKLKG